MTLPTATSERTIRVPGFAKDEPLIAFCLEAREPCFPEVDIFIRANVTWRLRKLKSLERTMRKVQVETEQAVNRVSSFPMIRTGFCYRSIDTLSIPREQVALDKSAGIGDGRGYGGSDAKRRPYTVGHRTVFLSDEELSMLKLTMGKDAAHLIPAPLATLEPALFANSSMHAASSALANAARCTARGPPRNAGDAAIADGSGSVGELVGSCKYPRGRSVRLRDHQQSPSRSAHATL